MALVPLVQPLAIRLLTTKKERKLCARCVVPPLKKEKLILFPLIAMIVCGILAPKNASLLGFLMLYETIFHYLISSPYNLDIPSNVSSEIS